MYEEAKYFLKIAWERAKGTQTVNMLTKYQYFTIYHALWSKTAFRMPLHDDSYLKNGCIYQPEKILEMSPDDRENILYALSHLQYLKAWNFYKLICVRDSVKPNPSNWHGTIQDLENFI